jgi:hypothetical protein
LWRAAEVREIATLSLCAGDGGGLTFIAISDAGAPVLSMENLRLRSRSDLPELSLEADQEAAE